MVTNFFLCIVVFLFFNSNRVNGASYENNKTNVGVYANHISSCNLDHTFGDMLCINRDYESVIQYHDVRTATFCPYHYCVTFRTETSKLACTGYSYLKMSGSMNEIINPLSTNDTGLAFSGIGDAKNIKIGSSFEGYNILIDYFRQSVETYFKQPLVSVECSEKMTTCVSLSDGSNVCFGATDLNFNDFLASVVLGVVVPGAMSFGSYLILWVVSTKYRWAKNGCIITIMCPIFVETCCMLILFVAADFIVKVLPFLLASIIGIWLGKVLTDIVTSCLIVWRKKLTGKVGDDYGSGERTGMLRRGGNSISDDSKFVIEEDNDLTEIELGTIKEEGDEEVEIKNI